MGRKKSPKKYKNYPPKNWEVVIPCVSEVSQFITLTNIFGKRKSSPGQNNPNTTRGLRFWVNLKVTLKSKLTIYFLNQFFWLYCVWCINACFSKDKNIINQNVITCSATKTTCLFGWCAGYELEWLVHQFNVSIKLKLKEIYANYLIDLQSVTNGILWGMVDLSPTLHYF